MQTFNEVLYKKRQEKGLTLKDASKKIGVWRFTLKNAELGYCPLSKKALKKASELYEVDLETLYDDTFAYTKTLPTKKKSSNFGKKLINVFKHTATRIVIIVLLVCSLISLGVGAFNRSEAMYNPRYFAESEYLVVYDNIINRGTQLENDIYSYTQEYQNGNSLFKVKKATNPFLYLFTGTLCEGDETFYLQYGSIFSSLQIFVATFEYSSDAVQYRGSFERINENDFLGIKYYEFVNDNWTVVGVEDQNYDEIENIIKEKMPKTDAIINQSIKTLTIDKSIYSLIKGAINSQGEIISHKLLLNIYLSFAITFFLTLVLIFSYFDNIKSIFKRKKNNTLEYSTIKKQTLCQKLPKDIKFFPPIKERWEQILGLVFLAVGGIGIVLGVCSILNVWGIPRSTYLQSVAEFLSELLPISMILLLYNKLDIYTKKENVAKTVLIFVLLGILFYLLEVISVYFITQVDGMSSASINKLIALFIPGNFFFGMALYATMAMFLFTMPKSCKTRKQQILWRCGVLIPIFYFVIGFLLNYSKQMFGFTITPYIQCFFFSKDLTITFFAFGLLLIKFFMQKHANTKYGKENGQLYCTGNRYALHFNFYTAILLSVIVLLGILVPSWVSGTSNFSFSTLLYVFVLLPLILLCAHRKETRTAKGDTSYTIVYAMLMCLPIFVCVGAVVEKITQLIF